MKKQAGFSLVQLMIVAGMLSGIFVVSLRIMKNQNQMGKSSSEEFEISYIFDDMRNLLSQNKACLMTLEKINPMQPSSIDGISNGEAKELEYQTFSSSGKLYGQNNLKISKIQYMVGDQESSVEDGEAFLSVSFEKSKSALGEKIVERKMKVHLVLDENNKLSSCFVLPGLNQRELNSEKKESIWYSVSGSENIYTNVQKASIAGARSPQLNGMSIKGRLRLGTDSSNCAIEKLGTLRYENEGFQVCSKKGWRNIWFPRQKVYYDEFTLRTNKRDDKKITERPYSLCAIGKMSLYGAKCLSRKLDGNLWELSLTYDRGKESTCSFKCFALR